MNHLSKIIIIIIIIKEKKMYKSQTGGKETEGRDRGRAGGDFLIFIISSLCFFPRFTKIGP